MIQIKRKPVHSRLTRFEDYFTGLLGLPLLWLKSWGKGLDVIPADGPEIAIVVIHNRRWIEWQIFSAFALRHKGFRPVLIYSGSELARLMSRLRPAERFLRGFHPKVLKLPDVRLIDLDTFLPAQGVRDVETFKDIELLSHMVTAYSLKVEEFESGVRPEYEEMRAANETMIRRFGHAAIAVLRGSGCKTVVCPNGRFGLSVPIRLAAERLGIRSVFVEGWGMRPGHMILGINRPAMDWDIEGWLKALGPWTDNLEHDFQDYMRFRAGEKVKREGWLDSFHQTQVVGKFDTLPEALSRFLQRPGTKLLYGSNCVGDSSTLGKATVFRSQKDLLEQLVQFVKNRPTLNLIIRVHPDEAVWFTNQPIAKIAKSLSAGIQNILVIGPHEKSNTHALMELCDVGLAWVSNFGLEMALKRKPVVLCADAPYRQLGLCHVPSTPGEFFALLEQLARHPELPTLYSLVENSGKAYLHILFNKMSIQAYGREYRLAELDLGNPDPERDRYFDIVTGRRTPFD